MGRSDTGAHGHSRYKLIHVDLRLGRSRPSAHSQADDRGLQRGTHGSGIYASRALSSSGAIQGFARCSILWQLEQTSTRSVNLVVAFPASARGKTWWASMK